MPYRTVYACLVTGLPTDGVGFTPSAEDIESVLAWFAEYDGYVAEANVERMAGMAMFPVNAVTDGSAESWSRERFIQSMGDLTAGDVTTESTRTPHFVNENLVFVITDGTVTVGERTQTVRYGDLLVKSNGQWKFQTMVQGGWGA